MTDKLRHAAQQALAALDELYYSNSTPLARKLYEESIATLRSALAEQPAEQEPVAHALVRPLEPDESERRVIVKWVKQPITGPLYTAPQPAKREPLTGVEKAAIWVKYFGNPIPPKWYAAAQELEAAHGIGGQT